MVDDIETPAETGDPLPELVPVAEPGARGPMPPQPADASGSEFALGDLLSDVLFGEVIDISDLIPSVLSAPAETAALPPPSVDPAVAVEADPSPDDVLALSGHAEALTILYDDDILASDGTIL